MFKECCIMDYDTFLIISGIMIIVLLIAGAYFFIKGGSKKQIK